MTNNNNNNFNTNDQLASNSNLDPGYSIQNILNFAAQQYAANSTTGTATTATLLKRKQQNYTQNQLNWHETTSTETNKYNRNNTDLIDSNSK